MAGEWGNKMIKGGSGEREKEGLGWGGFATRQPFLNLDPPLPNGTFCCVFAHARVCLCVCVCGVCVCVCVRACVHVCVKRNFLLRLVLASLLPELNNPPTKCPEIHIKHRFLKCVWALNTQTSTGRRLRHCAPRLKTCDPTCEVLNYPQEKPRNQR